MDSLDQPLIGATVQDQSAASTQTSTNGGFQLQTTAGRKHLTITRQGVKVLEQCLVVAEHVMYDLGTLTPTSPSHCDSVCTNDPNGVDPDCDGLTTEIETNGWDIVVTLGSGATETRHVQSDPNLKDTDGDGLSDAEEFAARTDPQRADTDGDGLSDYAEITVYKSNPLSVDTDGDSRGPDGRAAPDPNLWDGYEVAFSHTSPVLADTDGDGKTDYEEIHSGGTNPLVADLPMLALELNGDPKITVNADISAGCSSDTQNLTRDAQERVNTDKVSTEMSIKNTVNLHTETEAGTKTWPPSFSAKLTTDTEFKHSYMHETSATFTQSSLQQAETLAKCWEKNNVSYANGQIAVAMKLRNLSSLSFMVKDIRIIAYKVVSGGNFQLVGALDPDNWNSAGVVLGPNGEITMTVGKKDIDAFTTKTLVNNPSSLVFEVGGYELFQLDDQGKTETVNFNKLGESVVQRTGLITIDFGDGTIERHMVATNVNRNPDGSARGVTLKEALASILKIPYETETPKDSNGNVLGKKVLKKVKTTATYQDDPKQLGRGFWVIAGNSDAFARGIDTDFDDIALKNGERISLVFLKDTDLDGLFDNEEDLLGTNKLLQDTDGDGLSDYFETKVGWDVSVNGSRYHVYSDPRFADLDGDFLVDATEARYGSDPNAVDTDGDGVNDTNDRNPTAAECLDGNGLGLAAWWDGSASVDGGAADIWKTAGLGDPLGIASNGSLMGTDLLPSTINWKPEYQTTPLPNPVIMLNDDGEKITVADTPALDARRSISPAAQFTLSTWVYWDGAVTGSDWATLLSKGPSGAETYGLHVKQDGALALSLNRFVHEKRWNWLGDAACADADYALREQVETPPNLLQKTKWTHVIATFGDETVRIYVDGQKQLEQALNGTWDGGTCYSRRDTQYLIGTTEPLTIGLEPGAARWPYRGMLDDLQLFGRQMSVKEVEVVHQIGVCRP